MSRQTDPSVIKGGYDVHVYFDPDQLCLAREVYSNLLEYLRLSQIAPTHAAMYDKGPLYEGGPHRKRPSFVVHLMGSNPVRDKVMENQLSPSAQLGIALSWLMLNRRGLVAMVHPNTALPFGDVEREIADHTAHSVWLGLDHTGHLDLGFFEEIAREGASRAEEMARRRLGTSIRD